MSQLHPIIATLRQVQASEKRWLLVFSMSLFLAVVFASLILVCLADFYWRSDQPFVRSVQSVVLAVILVAAAIKILTPFFRFKRSLIEVAKAIESQKSDTEN